MGIFQLTAALQQMQESDPDFHAEDIATSPASLSPTPTPSPSPSPSPTPSQGPPLLLVDGLSWVLGMLNDTRIHGYGPAAESPRLEILGGLEAVRVLASESVAEWQDQLGFEVVAIFDGKYTTALKEETIQGRDDRAVKAREAQRLTCRGERFRAVTKVQLPEGTDNAAAVVAAVRMSTQSVGWPAKVVLQDPERGAVALDPADDTVVLAPGERSLYLLQVGDEVHVYTDHPAHVLAADADLFFHDIHALRGAPTESPADHRPRAFQHALQQNDFFQKEFHHVLADLGVRIMSAKCEADFEIPLLATRPGDYDPAWVGRETYVASGDSDFCFVKGCAWIPMNRRGRLDFLPLRPDGARVALAADGRRVVRVGVWRREKVAIKIGLDEHALFTAVALLMGNDHTKNRIDPAAPWLKERLAPLDRLNAVADFVGGLHDLHAGGANDVGDDDTEPWWSQRRIAGAPAKPPPATALDKTYAGVAAMLTRPQAKLVVDFNRAVGEAEPVFFHRLDGAGPGARRRVADFEAAFDPGLGAVERAREGLKDFVDGLVICSYTTSQTDALLAALLAALQPPPPAATGDGADGADGPAGLDVRKHVLEALHRHRASFPFATEIGLWALTEAMPCDSNFDGQDADLAAASSEPPSHADTVLARAYLELCKAVRRIHFPCETRAGECFVSAELLNAAPRPTALFCAASFHNRCVRARRAAGDLDPVNAFGIGIAPALGRSADTVTIGLRPRSPPRDRRSPCRFFFKTGGRCSNSDCRWAHGGESRRVRGRVVRFIEKPGGQSFGFIATRCLATSSNLFVHASQVLTGGGLRSGEEVEFEAVSHTDQRGNAKRCAINVVPVA